MTSHPHLFHHHRRNPTEDDQLWGDLHHNRRKHRAKLPVIPDLRFEYSYLRSISPYVQVERIRDDTASVSQYHHHSSVDDLLKDYDKLELHSSSGKADIAEETGVIAQSPSPKEVIHVQWKKVLWVTMRDQVISPLLQGALWAIASYFLTPYSAHLGSKLGQLILAKPPPKEGPGAGWLRRWVKSLGLTSKSVEEPKR